MRDPYEVLGVPRSATEEQIKDAYRRLAKQYHPDQYANSPLAENANRKMQEINEAYDAIMNGTAKGGSSHTDYSAGIFNKVASMMNENRLDEAESVLESMAEPYRTAYWYYLKGQINYRRGWTDQAYTYFTIAYQQEPSNPQYRSAWESMNKQRSGGFRTAQPRHNSSRSSDCDGCDMCCGLLCADGCCECCGGDLIPCC